jgi:hypothetical protein
MKRRIFVDTEWTAPPWSERSELPRGWPARLHDINAAALAAGVEIPPRAADHFHPRVHAEWNRELFERIRATGGPVEVSIQ